MNFLVIINQIDNGLLLYYIVSFLFIHVSHSNSTLVFGSCYSLPGYLSWWCNEGVIVVSCVSVIMNVINYKMIASQSNCFVGIRVHSLLCHTMHLTRNGVPIKMKQLSPVKYKQTNVYRSLSPIWYKKLQLLNAETRIMHTRNKHQSF